MIASGGSRASEQARAGALADRVALAAWFDVSRRTLSADAVAVLASRSIVLLGETHDDPAHHRWQLDTIRALFDRRPDMALGFEMFPRSVQPAVDRWCADELDENGFLSAVDWPRIWGVDPNLYLPLFRFAKTNRLPMVALNIDAETRRRVASEGFTNVSRSQREGVGEPAPASQRYRQRLLTWFERHPAAGDPARFERFVRAQQFWDRAMAEAIADVRRRDNRLIVGIMGSGHVEYGDGVPHQLAALGESDIATALPWPADSECPIGDPPIADFLFGVSPQIAE